MPARSGDSSRNVPFISVVIVNWNGEGLLRDCLNSLREQQFRDFETIVVDNGSEDGSVELVRGQYPEARLVTLSRNLGFAAGSNAGINIASGSYIALLNNDTRAATGWLAELARAVRQDPSVGMWASKILSMDEPDVIDNVGLLLYRDGTGRGKGRGERDNGQYDRPEEVFFPSGCAALYSRDLLDAVGLLDEEYFAYADDVDLGLRGRLAGWRCVTVPSAVVYHKYSASSSAYSPFKAFLVERNRIWVMLKYFPWELILASPWFTAKRMLLHLYGSLTGRGASGRFAEQYSVGRAVLILLRSWTAALRRLPRVLGQRRAFNRKRRITRRELFRLFRTFGISASEVALKE
jgi:GT2 family glycosyltransferase